MMITEPVQNKGFNVTTDNFFTSFELAKKLQKEGISIVGTVYANSKTSPEKLLVLKKVENMAANSTMKSIINVCL